MCNFCLEFLFAGVGGTDADEARIRDERYDCVLHLVTAADGAVEHYTTANNATRDESPEQAIAVDRRTRGAWLGSPVWSIVGNENTTSFRDKAARAVGVVSKRLEIPAPGVVKRYFLCKAGHDDGEAVAALKEIGDGWREFEITHIYIQGRTLLSDFGEWLGESSEDDGVALLTEVRVTARREIHPHTVPKHGPGSVEGAPLPVGPDGELLTATYSGLTSDPTNFLLRARRLREGVPPPEGIVQEHLRFLSGREFAAIVSRRDKAFQPVVKRRRLLWHGSRSLEWDELVSPEHAKGTVIVAVEVGEGEADIPGEELIPAPLQYEREVTREAGFESQSLAIIAD